VTVTGTGLTGASAVKFGSTAATSYTVVSSAQITSTTPVELAGTVDVTVGTPSGTSSTSSADQFTYEGVSTGVQVTVPGAPTNVSATAGNAAATVTWSLPADNGSAIVTYTVIATDSTNSSNGGESSVVDGAAMTSCIVAGLTNGDSYTFTVTSTNGVGTGPASSDSNPVTPMAVPGAPRNVSATRGDASVTVSWTAPSSDGGSAITRYVVIVSGSGAKACVTAGTTSCTVTSLSNGIAYTFTVTAANEFGTGPASSASNQITLLAPSRTALKMSATTLTYGDEQVEQLSVVVSSQYSGSMPTGTVNLSESGVRLCTITLSAGAGSCRLDATRLDARDYHIVAAYRGDDVFVSSVTGGRLTVVKAPSTTAFKLSATALTYGDEQVENLTVTVSSQYPGSMPTGIVTVRGQSLTLCTITLSAGSGSCSLSATQLAMGSHQVFATYHGDEALVRSVAGESLTVVRPSPSTTAFQLSATTLTYGDEQVENMTVTVSSQVPGSMPTGIVTVRGQSLRLCTITLSAGSGSCSLSATELAVGSHQVFATYHGDEALLRSVAGESLTVVRPSSRTALELSATTLTYGDEQAEHLTVTVSSPYAGSAPTGTVNLSESAITLCTVTLSAGAGSCILSARQLSLGNYQVVAVYRGDGSFEPSITSGRVLVTAVSGTALNLSATELIYGDEQAEHLTVTVSSKYSGLKPTGTVTVSESSMALCTITLSAGSGSCTLSARRLAVGTYDVIAAYSGDKSFEPSATGDRLTVVA
jgi:hypothetical protein